MKAQALALLARIASASILASGAAWTQDLTPEWISDLPIGSSLSAGIGNMARSADGVSYWTGTGGSSSNTDVITAAFAGDGTLLWSQVYNGPGNWHDQGHDVALGPGGVLYVTGNTPGPGSYANVLLLKYDAASGSLLDTLQYSSAPFTSEHGARVAVDSLGNIYIGGGTVGDGGDVMLLKLDSAGQLVWRQAWDGPASAPYSQDSVKDLLLDPAGNPVLLIHGVMASNQPDYVVTKLGAADGVALWLTTWGSNGGDYPRDMEIDAAGDVYATGMGIDFSLKFSTLKLRGSDGLLLWQAYDTTGYHNGVDALTLDGVGGVYITGRIDPDGDESNENWNIYTIKRAADTGAQAWTHLYGANCLYCFDIPSDVVADGAGNVFVGGTTSSPPYSGDRITLVLDQDTGLEIRRGIVASALAEIDRAGVMLLDAARNLYDAGVRENVNTGQRVISLVKYGALASGSTGFCNGADGSLASCPCGNVGDPDSGCDLQQGTGGVGLALVVQETTPENRVTWIGSGFPDATTPTSLVIRAPQLDPTRPQVFGDGVRCVGTQIVRLAATFASGGTAVHTHGHGSAAGAGTFYYQLWFRNNPAMFCTPDAFNLSSGRMLTW